MSITCRKCGKQLPPHSRFCGGCGTDPLITSVGGRTVVNGAAAPSMTGTLSSAEHRTIVQRLQRQVGSTIVAPVSGMHSDPGQREFAFLIIDISGSMASRYDHEITKLEAAAQAAQTLILNKDPEDEIGIIVFDHRADLLMELRPISQGKHEALSIFQNLTSRGGTDLAAGLKLAERFFEWRRDGIVRRVIMLTDGNGGAPERIASQLKSQGVVLDIIGIGADADRGDVNERLLKKIASSVAGGLRYRFLSSLDELVGHYTILAGKTAVR